LIQAVLLFPKKFYKEIMDKNFLSVAFENTALLGLAVGLFRGCDG
jgi:hypothetical protein